MLRLIERLAMDFYFRSQPTFSRLFVKASSVKLFDDIDLLKSQTYSVNKFCTLLRTGTNFTTISPVGHKSRRRGPFTFRWVVSDTHCQIKKGWHLKNTTTKRFWEKSLTLVLFLYFYVPMLSQNSLWDKQQVTSFKKVPVVYVVQNNSEGLCRFRT